MSKKKIVEELYGKEKKPIYTANFEGLCDLVLNDDEVKFLTLENEIKDQVPLNGKLYFPPDYEKLGFELPIYNLINKYYNNHTTYNNNTITDVTAVSNEDKRPEKPKCSECPKLFQKLWEFHYKSAEPPDEKIYNLIVAFDFHTHLIEKFEYSPILVFVGLPEKGKSLMGESIISVARRGIMRPTMTEAALLREATDQKATLLFDMTDFWKTIETINAKDVILSRFKRGLKVPRVKNPEKGAFQDMVYYDVFGSTLITSNESLAQVLETRALSFIFQESQKDFSGLIDKKEALDLKNQLVAWRLAHFNNKLPNIPKLVKGRLGDILRPLHQIILMTDPTREIDFKLLVKDIEKNKQITKSDTVEADLLLAIIESSEKVHNAALAVKEITDKYNSEKSDKEKLTYQKVGRTLDLMGFQKGKTGTGASAIIWNEGINSKLIIEYNLSSVTTRSQETQETSEKEVNGEERNFTETY